MKKIIGAVRTFWQSVRVVQSFLGTLIFFLVLSALTIIFFLDTRPQVPSSAVLIIAPVGQIVESTADQTGLDILLENEGGRSPETLMRTIASAIRNAKTDEHIKAIVINLDFLTGAGVSQLYYIGELLDDFRTSGKPVYAFGLYYSDDSYLIASHADEVYLHPTGSVFLSGYQLYAPYLKTALDKIKAKVYVFRSGAYKSYGENYERDFMSAPAKEENLSLLNDLWDRFIVHVTHQRGIEEAEFRKNFETLSGDLRKAQGDPARLALAKGLIDGILSEDEWIAKMVALVGAEENPEGYRNIYLEDYAHAVDDGDFFTSARVAVVVVRGEIVFGESQGSNSGSLSVVEQLRRARLDEHVKAVVLRVDSPGGSLVASQQILEEIVRVKAAGLPVVVSMGAVAASGGYWISAPADEIWADASTITGSIGVVGVFPTFDRSLEWLGVHIDGVGTTPLSGDFSPLRPLSPLAQDLFQQSVDASYRSFVEMVAHYRSLTPQAVDAIGQGRIWSGRAALQFKLVDRLGNLDQAIAAAAARAHVRDYDFVYYEKTSGFSKNLFKLLFAVSTKGDGQSKIRRGPADEFLTEVGRLTTTIKDLNDPKGIYVLCETCRIN